MSSALEQVCLLLLDVDGVLTDGRITYDEHGRETKSFDVKDGHGIKLLMRAGLQIGIITGRRSPIVTHRAQELGIDIVHQGALDKRVPYEAILEELGLTDAQVAYVGDDLIDLPILCRVGFSAAVADAVDEVKAAVHYVSRRRGGRGAVREICDHILKGSGRWPAVAARYGVDWRQS